MMRPGIFSQICQSMTIVDQTPGRPRCAGPPEGKNCSRIAVMESRLLDILVCPLCKGRLEHDRQRGELICRADRLAFPVRDGIPVMLESEARELDETPAAA